LATSTEAKINEEIRETREKLLKEAKRA